MICHNKGNVKNGATIYFVFSFLVEMKNKWWNFFDEIILIILTECYDLSVVKISFSSSLTSKVDSSKS